jgi:2-polyprenyl-6-methoxyphenol hydroxylase-like FAD-dependent oxidoreductase
MTKIVMIGGGVCGLAAAMMLTRDGHDITVLERDDAPVPDSAAGAWDEWSRDGVKQFRQPHYLQPGGWAILKEALPNVGEALEAAGALRFDALGVMPPSIDDQSRRPGDERFVTLTARRPVLEHVLGAAAQAEPGLEMRRGVAVQALMTRQQNGTPRVTGVRLQSGRELSAELVVDAMGRRSELPRWLRAAGGAPMHEEAAESGFIYYSRFFQSPDGQIPALRGPILASLGSFSVLTLPGDNATWSVTVYISRGDQALKRLRDSGRWSSVVAACPLQAHWLEGEPITDVLAMGGVVDRYRRMVVDGRPAATGIVPLADAWACTNPSLGRGMALGLRHAKLLREAVREHGDEPSEFARAWDALTEEQLTPWYRETVEENRSVLEQLETSRNGTNGTSRVAALDPLRSALFTAMTHDADLFRVFLDSRCCIAPLKESLARADVAQRVLEVARGRGGVPLPGPSRDELLALLN